MRGPCDYGPKRKWKRLWKSLNESVIEKYKIRSCGRRVYRLVAELEFLCMKSRIFSETGTFFGKFMTRNIPSEKTIKHISDQLLNSPTSHNLIRHSLVCLCCRRKMGERKKLNINLLLPQSSCSDTSITLEKFLHTQTLRDLWKCTQTSPLELLPSLAIVPPDSSSTDGLSY